MQVNIKVENALILSAGFGTRMGEIGKVLPKVVWPIFNKSLIELQVLYLREIGVRNIFINLHFQKEAILKECEGNSIFDDVIFLEEKKILGVGGAIHNLARHGLVDYKGKLLVVNADQFSFFDDEYWQKANQLSDAYGCALFATYVDQKFEYSETLLDQNNFLRVINPKDEQSSLKHLTYAGFGFVNLEKLTPKDGESSFFQSVADYKNQDIPMVILPEDFEYWDFGTKERYFGQMQKLKSSNSEFSNFLKKVNCVEKKTFYYQDKCQNHRAILLDASNKKIYQRYRQIIQEADSGNYILGRGLIQRVGE